MKRFLLCLIALLVSLGGNIAYAGDITFPLGTTGSNSTAPYLNSWFDHDSTSNSLTIFDGSLPQGDVSLAGCTIRINCYDSHRGIDYEASMGTPLYAAMSGTVKVASDQLDGLGVQLRIWNAGSGYSVITAHMSSVVVAVTNSVYRGQLIGYSGNSGNVSAHLHFGA